MVRSGSNNAKPMKQNGLRREFYFVSFPPISGSKNNTLCFFLINKVYHAKLNYFVWVSPFNYDKKK